ncbi:MAG: response regulator [Burkholderiales bacterium]|nr:response regulator [Burkholderiales bacterium]
MRVLVVDDDSISRMVLRSILASLGIFDVVEAEDGDVAWNLLMAGLRPAICFCDGRMPHLSGLGLLEKLASDEKLQRIPFVMASANSEKEEVQQALALGANGRVVKPYDIAEVRAQLNHLVRNALGNLAESPSSTLKRLNLTAPQLQAYLLAFANQLEQANLDLQSCPPQEASYQQKLEKLQQASQTLGLHYAATVLGEARWRGWHTPQVENCLQMVKNTVQFQISLLKA